MCCVGVFHGVRLTVGNLFQVKRNPLPCDKWKCKECGPKKMKILFSRIMNGALIQIAKIDGFRSKYAVKLLTLTCPGKEYRASKTPRKAYDEMAKCFDKLIRALKKQYGEFHYFRVREFHEDGFPHFHVLLTGLNIAPPQVLKTIRDLWQHKYKMGNVDIQVKKKNQTVEKAIRYIIKYVEKDPGERQGFDKLRLFTASRGALQKLLKNPSSWLFHKVKFKNEGPEDELPHVFDFEKGICIDEVPFIHQRFLAIADTILPMKILG